MSLSPVAQFRLNLFYIWCLVILMWLLTIIALPFILINKLWQLIVDDVIIDTLYHYTVRAGARVVALSKTE